MKGLILAGGAGTRLRPLTYSSAKQLVPVANKPVLFYGIEAMRDAGIRDITIVISPGQPGMEIRKRAGDGSQWGLKVGYVEQGEALGLAHAVLTGEEAIGESPFVVYLGDNLLRDGIQTMVEQFKSSQPEALILLQHVDDPRAFGVAELDGDRVVQLTEKPSEPRSDLALVGVYMFQPGIFDVCRSLEPSPRGEYEITEAIQALIDQGKRVEPHVVTGWWKDTGKWEDMLETNRLLLDAIEPQVDGELIDSRIEGRVSVGEGSTLERCQVRGPVAIGAGAVLKDAYIGPYSAIADGCQIERAEIENSIVLENSKITDLEHRLEGSLIGRNVVIGGQNSKPRAYRILVGDDSKIGIL
ncbi:MAG: glucose-1-phosphate thymidylyltransferase [Actinobacteria bacterium]|nr:glucose-1-phosphate thymidylyltransferase [Actinomycetota bacterium]